MWCFLVLLQYCPPFCSLVLLKVFEFLFGFLGRVGHFVLLRFRGFHVQRWVFDIRVVLGTFGFSFLIGFCRSGALKQRTEVYYTKFTKTGMRKKKRIEILKLKPTHTKTEVLLVLCCLTAWYCTTIHKSLCNLHYHELNST